VERSQLPQFAEQQENRPQRKPLARTR